MNRTVIIGLLLLTVPLVGCVEDDTGNGTPGEVTVSWTQEPQDMQTGESIHMEWELDGPEGEITHTGVHYADHSVSDPQSPADYGNSSGVEEPAQVPGTYDTDITFDEEGTYYIIAHAIVDGEHLWSEEVEVTVSEGGPVDSPLVVEVDDAPMEASTGENITVNWSLTGVPGQIQHTGFHWSDQSVEDPKTPGDYNNTAAAYEPADVPGSYNATFVVEDPATIYGRAHAIMDGKHYWSDEVEIEVTSGAMGGNMTGPQTHTVQMLDIVGAPRFEPANLTVHPGDNITWVNNGSLPHTATNESFNLSSGQVSSGGEFTWMVPLDLEPGTYGYVCTNHEDAGMVASFTVEEA